MIRLLKAILELITQSIKSALEFSSSADGIKHFYSILLYRNAAYLTLNSLVTAVTGFLFWVLAARLYPDEIVGLASAVISAMSLLTLFANLGLDFALIRFIPESKNPSTLLKTCFIVSSLTAVVISVTFIIGLSFWSPRLLLIKESGLFIAVFIIVTTLSTIQGFTRQAFIAYRKASLSLAQGLTFGLSKFIALLFLTGLLTLGVFTAWGIGSGLAVVVGMLLLTFATQVKFKISSLIDLGVLKRLIRFSLQNYLANMIWTIPGFVFPLLIVNMIGAQENAYFYIATRVSAFLSIVSIAVSTSLFAEGSYEEQAITRHVRRSLKFTNIVLIPLVIVFLFGSNLILQIFGDTYSQMAAGILRIFAIASIPANLNLIYFSKKRVQRKMTPVILLTIFISGGILALSAIFLPRYGIIVPGIANLIFQSIGSLLVLYDLLKQE